MSDITDFEAFRNRKKQEEATPELVDFDLSDRKKLIYQDVNGWWQVIIEGENIPASQYELMPDHVIAQIQTERVPPPGEE